ncbi:MAG: hypothetical protein AB4290_26750 [Spirulina sp.]
MKIKKTIFNLVIGVGTFALSPVYFASPTFAQATRAAECNLVINVVNEAIQAAQSANTDDPEEQIQALLTAADSIDEVVEKMMNLSVRDNSLNEHRQALISIYRQTSLITRRFVDAFSAENQAELTAILEDLDTATRDEERLIIELSRYCSPPSNSRDDN